MKIYAQNKMVAGITFLGMVEYETSKYITVNGKRLFKSDYKIEILCNLICKLDNYQYICVMNNDLNEIKAMLAAILVAVGTILGLLINHIK